MLQGLPHHELTAWLRFSLEKNLGLIGAINLLRAVGPPTQIYKMSARALAHYLSPELARQLAAPPSSQLAAHIERTLTWVDARPNRHLITLADPRYPTALLATADPPLLLYVRGDPSVLVRPILSIVGTRNATVGGIENARGFARYLATQGWCITSGLAHGIDTAAHQGALEAGPRGASTLAMMGTGIDLIYPRQAAALAERIATEGALVSELPLGSSAKPYHFPKRNRLIAGIAQGVLVVEAARQSGSLITAKLAIENGREVFALPGSIHSPLSRGCHALIQQGATLIENARDIIHTLRPTVHNLKVTAANAYESIPLAHPYSGNESQPSESEQDESGHQAVMNLILAALGYEPVHLDTLLARTKLDSACLLTQLLALELAGKIARLPGGYFQCLQSLSA